MRSAHPGTVRALLLAFLLRHSKTYTKGHVIVSEKKNKSYRKILREHGLVEGPKPEPVLGHSNALCKTGRHDFARPYRYVKKHSFLGLRTVVERGPRLRTCRQCKAVQAHCTTGQWINATR